MKKINMNNQSFRVFVHISVFLGLIVFGRQGYAQVDVTMGLQNTQVLASQEYKLNPYLKPGAPVRLKSPSEYVLQAGDSVTLELALGVLTEGELTITFDADAGLAMEGGETVIAEGKEQVIVPLVVSAKAAALAYVHVFIGFKSAAGQYTRRTYALAFDSRGAQPLLFKSAVRKPFVEMQAQETIR